MRAALDNPQIETIALTGNFSTSTTVSVNRAVDIDGQNHAITFTNTGQNFVVLASGTNVHDLTIKNTAADTTEWNSTYAIQFYNGTYDIHDLTATGANAGILINSSTATIGDNVDVSGNNFGGIEVSQSSNPAMPASQATINSVITNTTEAYGKPTVWTDGENATVVDNTGMTANGEVKAGQVQYYLNEENSHE